MHSKRRAFWSINRRIQRGPRFETAQARNFSPSKDAEPSPFWRRGAGAPPFPAPIGRGGCTFAQGPALALSGSSGCTKSSGSHSNLFRVSRRRWEAEFNNLRTPSRHDCAFLPPPTSTLSHRRHSRFKVSICFKAFKRGRVAAERVKPLSLWLPERGCFAENGVIALLFLLGRGGERSTFREL